MKYVVGFILVLVMLATLMNACSPSESDRFRDQMKKDPSTWSQTEVDRFNGFMDWLDD